MKITIILLVIFLSAPTITFGQTPKDYYNVEVQTTQGATTNKIIKYLELDSVDVVLSYFSKEVDKSLLKKASTDIRKIYQKTEGKYVIVYDEGYNIFRYRYTNKGVFYLIDLYFNEGDTNSKVVKVITKNKATLDKEKKKNNSGNVPPPPVKKK